MSFEKQPVNTIESASYDKEQEILRVRFTNGAAYDYHGVDADLVRAFREAPCAGEFVTEILRPGCPASKVEEGEDTKHQVAAVDHDLTVKVSRLANLSHIF